MPLKVMGKGISRSQTEGDCLGLGETPRADHVAESPFCPSIYLQAPVPAVMMMELMIMSSLLRPLKTVSR